MPILRKHTGNRGETNIEVFFDLVYAFAITQLSSRFLLGHQSLEGALQTVLLLAMVWLGWSYTMWLTNWLDPAHISVRLLLLALMLASLVFSAGIPDAFGARGLEVGGAYAGMQVGRSLFAVIALRGEKLQLNYERILAWCTVSGALAIAGGLEHGTRARAALAGGGGGRHGGKRVRLLCRRSWVVRPPRTGTSKGSMSRNVANPSC